MRRSITLTCTALALMAVAGCGGGGDSTAAHQSQDDAAASSVADMTNSMKQTTEAAPSTSAVPAAAQIGQQVTAGGVTLTVTSAAPVPSISMNETNYDSSSPYAKFTNETPPAGAEYFAVATHVTNNSQVSMDLTCSYPIATKLVNAQQQQYDPIESLYKLKGNPKCNAQLGPGFSNDMTYVYMVPAGTQVLGWAFADATTLGAESAFTAVRF